MSLSFSTTESLACAGNAGPLRRCSTPVGGTPFPWRRNRIFFAAKGGDLPFVLLAAVLVGDLVHPPLQGFAEPEVVPVQREHLLVLDSIEGPVAERDLDLLHPLLTRFADDFGPFDDSEGFEDFLATGGELGADAGSCQPLQGRFEGFVALAVRHPVRGLQQIVGLEMQHGRDGLSGVLGRHQLADAIDQDVAIMNRRQSFGRRHHLEVGRTMLIEPDPVIGLRGQREDGMFHRRHVPFGSRVAEVADEEFGAWRLSGRRGGRSLTGSMSIRRYFDISPTASGVSIDHTPTHDFEGSHTDFRCFTHGISMVHPPGNSNRTTKTRGCERCPQRSTFISTRI